MCNNDRLLCAPQVCVDNYSPNEYEILYFGLNRRELLNREWNVEVAAMLKEVTVKGDVAVKENYRPTKTVVSHRTLHASQDGTRVQLALDKFSCTHVFIILLRDNKEVASSVVEGNNKWVIDAKGHT